MVRGVCSLSPALSGVKASPLATYLRFSLLSQQLLSFTIIFRLHQTKQHQIDTNLKPASINYQSEQLHSPLSLLSSDSSTTNDMCYAYRFLTHFSKPSYTIKVLEQDECKSARPQYRLVVDSEVVQLAFGTSTYQCTYRSRQL